MVQFAAVGLADRVHFLVQEPDTEDGKRGCFCAHQQAARRALELGARRTLTFEDDVEFTANFTPFAVARAAKFLKVGSEPWEIFFLGHFPRKMEMTTQRDIVKVRSMDGHAYLLSSEGMHRLCALDYRGDQVGVARRPKPNNLAWSAERIMQMRCRWTCTSITTARRRLRCTRWWHCRRQASVTPKRSSVLATGTTTS